MQRKPPWPENQYGLCASQPVWRSEHPGDLWHNRMVYKLGNEVGGGSSRSSTSLFRVLHWLPNLGNYSMPGNNLDPESRVHVTLTRKDTWINITSSTFRCVCGGQQALSRSRVHSTSCLASLHTCPSFQRPSNHVTLHQSSCRQQVSTDPQPGRPPWLPLLLP